MAAPPPGPLGPLPEVEQVNAQYVSEGTPVVNTSAVTIIGDNFTGATLKVSYSDGQGGTEEHALTMASVSDDEMIMTEDDWYQEARLSSNFKDLTFTITTPNGSTSVQASYQPE